MTALNITLKKLFSDVTLPKYAHQGDAAMDVHSREHRTLEQGEPHVFRLGFASDFPAGWVASIQDRSSMGKRGVRVLGGIIDASYRGEWGVILVNLTDKEVVINKGDRIAQVLFLPVGVANIQEKELSSTTRGTSGFGSTGK